MDINFKTRVDQGQTVIGSLAFLPSPDITEIMALAGFDFVIIDTEHSPKDWGTITHMIRAAQLHGTAPLVRVWENNEKLILQALEIGAAGIVVPFINCADDVRRVVRAMRYSPQGKRGSCSVTRAAEYSRKRPDFLHHCEQSNASLPFVAIIEDVMAVERIDEIVSCETPPDILMVGRSDLASSLGRPGQVEDPKVLEATQRIIDAAHGAARPIAVCMIVYDGKESQRWLEKGCTVLCYPSDSSLFFNAARAAVSAIGGPAPDKV